MSSFVKNALGVVGALFGFALVLIAVAFAYSLVFGDTPLVRTNRNVTTERRVPVNSEQSGVALQPPTEAPAPVCDVPGSVFVKEIGQCVYHMTDPIEVQKYSPDIDSDPKCKGRPDGFRYDEKVRDESGRVGIAHRVCGSRSAN